MFFRLVLASIQNGVQGYNVFYYERTAGTAGAAALSTAFRSTVCPAIRALISTSVTQQQLDVANLSDPTDFNTATIGIAGTRGGEYLPPYCCWTYRFNRSRRDMRNGWKRFAGISEGDQGNGIISAPMVGIANTLASSMNANQTDGAGTTWRPVLYAKAIPSRPVAFYAPIASVAYIRISTQNTRKYG